jgi:hypothetical protein
MHRIRRCESDSKLIRENREGGGTGYIVIVVGAIEVLMVLMGGYIYRCEGDHQ